MPEDILVSVIIPVYNEEKYIKSCLESMAEQTFPHQQIEWIIVDGMSKDRTLSIVKSFTSLDNIRILENKKSIVTYALNLGIQHALGRYILRMDAHAKYDKDYIEKCVYYMEHVEADNVGGIVETQGLGYAGNANSEILSSKFGVGNASFRIGSDSGYVDTVPYGCFRREIFNEIGLFDVELPRSEDNDFNARIRENGGKVYLANDIHSVYYCRDSVIGLLNQGIKNGNALFLTLRKNPKAMSLRHFIPFCFVLSLITLPLLGLLSDIFFYILGVEIVSYLLSDLMFSFSGKIQFLPYKFVMYPAFHVAYGIGSVLGLFKVRLY